jgi:LPS-assembly lipoprotein
MSEASIRILLLLACCAGLVSCGFQLRGSEGSNLALHQVHVSATNAYGEMQQELERGLTESGVTLLPDVAPYTVRLLTERTARRAVASTASNTVSDYEIRSEVVFDLVDAGGQVVIPETRLFAERIYTSGNASLVSRSREEGLLIEEMRTEIAGQLIRRIDAAVRGRVR